ncbi:uncharacterized protein LOC129004285 [Macrosteles quadrilineatus]|uniref:uncharacterized protein LOC129004285 n=1 Tax=Macrosteles quadrilineatus TaxID=74068 RepID=UPI0023E0FAA4|nr:uncharacterized protein LOC129004285 [Macrosteles quadrilineatus]
MHALRPLIQTSTKDSSCFYGTNLLNDNCVNSYLRLIERRSHYYDSYPMVYAFDSYFFPAWKRGNYEKVRKWTKGTNIFSRDLLIFPIHAPDIGESGHWSVIIVWTKTHHITTYDSLGLNYPWHATVVMAFLQEEAKAKKVELDPVEWLICGTPADTPRQTNKWDCGIFVCAFAEIIARKEKLTSVQICPKELRKQMCAAIRRGKIESEDFRLLEPPITDRIRFTPMTTPLVKIRTFIHNGSKLEVVIPSDPVLEDINKELNRMSRSKRMIPEFSKPRKTSREDLPNTLPYTERPPTDPPKEDHPKDSDDCLLLTTSDVEMDDETNEEVESAREPPTTAMNAPAVEGKQKIVINPHTSLQKGNRYRPKRVKVWMPDGSFQRMNVNRAKAYLSRGQRY